MTKSHSTCLRALICLVLLSICQVVPAQGVKTKETGTTDPNQVLQDLLAEVHGLRQALERAATNASRAQILMERIRIAQPKVDNLTSQLSVVRKGISQEITNQTNFTEMISKCESNVAANQMSPLRADYEKQCKSDREMLDNAKQEEQELRAQESQLATQLQIEQSKLDDLNGRLDKLDRELQEAQPVDKAPTRKNP